MRYGKHTEKLRRSCFSDRVKRVNPQVQVARSLPCNGWAQTETHICEEIMIMFAYPSSTRVERPNMQTLRQRKDFAQILPLVMWIATISFAVGAHKFRKERLGVEQCWFRVYLFMVQMAQELEKRAPCYKKSRLAKKNTERNVTPYECTDGCSRAEISPMRYCVSSCSLLTTTLSAFFGDLLRIRLSTLESHDLPLRL